MNMLRGDLGIILGHSGYARGRDGSLKILWDRSTIPALNGLPRPSSSFYTRERNFIVSLWLHQAACGILVPTTRDWTWAPAVKVPSPNNWTPRELSIFNALRNFLMTVLIYIPTNSIQVFSFLHTLTSLSVQSLSRVWLFATPWTAACQASLLPS